MQNHFQVNQSNKLAQILKPIDNDIARKGVNMAQINRILAITELKD